MDEINKLRDAVNLLGREVSELKPVVLDVHSNMPRIAQALETLAKVTARQEASHDEHKRIHYRIAENENNISAVRNDVGRLKERIDKVREEQVICLAGQKVKKKDLRIPLLERIRSAVAEKVIVVIVLATLGFFGWLVVYHLPKYPVTAPIIKHGEKK